MFHGKRRRMWLLVVCANLVAAPVWAQPRERYDGLPDDLSRTLNTIRHELSGDVAKQHATEIWERDRWDSWDRHHQTAQYVAEQLRQIGLDGVEVIPYKSDGRTRYGDWTSPLAWDVEHARLTVVEPDPHAARIVADYRDTPQVLMTRCGPTPAGGIQAEVVAIRDDDQHLSRITDENLRGKLVLIKTVRGRSPSAKVIAMAKRAGALTCLRATAISCET